MKFLTPNFFLNNYKTWLISLIIIFIPLMIFSLHQALIVSPPDYQQGQLVRIMYVHVPSAWLCLSIYSLMAACSFANLIWGNKLAYVLAGAMSTIGACFTAITIITGSIWGYQTWGAFWVWDARLTSILVLLMFYLGYIGIFNNHRLRAEKPCAIISLIGFINVPIVKFSVDIWATLHQGSSVLTLSGPKIHLTMLKPLLLMFASFSLLFLILLILRCCNLLASMSQENIQQIKEL